MLLKNATIIIEDQIYENMSILIEENCIKKISKEEIEDQETYDMQGKIVLPGFINTHVHLNQQLGRGIADDVDLLTWLEKRVWPYEASLDEEEAYLSAMACICELIKSGVTTFLEAGGQHVEMMAKAVKDSGIRASLCKSTMDFGKNIPKSILKTTQEELQMQEELIKKYHNTENERLKIWLGLRTIFSNSEELIKGTKELAQKYNTNIHMHVCEIESENEFSIKTHGLSTVKYLDSLGILDSNFLAVHTVWLDEEDLKIFAKRKVNVSCNPAAAMKVVLGFLKIQEMIDLNIPVSIGTDGAPSNNQMNIMRDMYLASIIYKGNTLNPTTVNALQVLKMVSKNAAICAGMENEIGQIRENMKADLVILDPNYLHSLPMYDIINNIVYSFDRENVFGTMVDGKWLYYNKKLTFINEQQLIEDIIFTSKKIKERIFGVKHD